MEHGDKNSMRFAGKRIDELNHRQRMGVLTEIAKAEKEQRLRDILKKYGKFDKEQLEAAIRQMEGNIKALQATQVSEHEKIKEYRNLMGDCDLRDKELAEAGFDARTVV